MKTIGLLFSDLSYEDQVKKVCAEIEISTSVEYCYILNRYNSVLLTERESQTILVEMKPEDTLSNICTRRQPLFLNDIQKERNFINFLKTKLKVKIYNALVLPVCVMGAA
jgi:hypothetical protein